MIVTTRKTGQKTDSVMASIGPVVTGPERAVYVDSEASFGYAVGALLVRVAQKCAAVLGQRHAQKERRRQKEQRS
jgi:hypothetical protein